jgi:predicted Rossmann-fold nucleotide-binding protein
MGVLNVAGYFDPMIALLDHAVSQEFVNPEHRRHLIVSANPESLVGLIMSHAGGRNPRQKIDLGTA